MPQNQPTEEWKKLRRAAEKGLSVQVVEALEAYFETEKNTFLFRDQYGQMLAPDHNTLVLMAAVRDGQRQVISTLRHILKTRQCTQTTD
jgi:hypothetical protein